MDPIFFAKIRIIIIITMKNGGKNIKIYIFFYRYGVKNVLISP